MANDYYRERGRVRAALNSLGPFADALRGWDQVARQNVSDIENRRFRRDQFDEAKRARAFQEELTYSALPETLGLEPQAAPATQTGRTRGGRGAAGAGGGSATLRDALGLMESEERLRPQLQALREEDLAGAQQFAKDPRPEAYKRYLAGSPERQEAARGVEIWNRAPEGVGIDAPSVALDQEARLAAFNARTTYPQAQGSMGAPGWDDESALYRALYPAPAVVAEQAPAVVAEQAPNAIAAALAGDEAGQPAPQPTVVAEEVVEVVDPATTPGSGESVAMGLAGEAAEEGELAIELRKRNIQSVEEAKAALAEINAEKGLVNPIAEFSDGVLPDTALPGMRRLSVAIALAKSGDRSKISQIMGRSVEESEVKDLDKLMADYRAYASGVRLKADEAQEILELDEIEKENARGDSFAFLVRGDLGTMKPDLPAEDLDVIANKLGRMYVKDPTGAAAVLNLYKGMNDTRLRELARKEKAAAAARRASSKLYGGNKQAFNTWKEQKSKWLAFSKTAGEHAKTLRDLETRGADEATVASQRALLADALKAVKDSREEEGKLYRLVAHHSGLAGVATPPSVEQLDAVFDSQLRKDGTHSLTAAKDPDKWWAGYRSRLIAPSPSGWGMEMQPEEATEEANRQRRRYESTDEFKAAAETTTDKDKGGPEVDEVGRLEREIEGPPGRPTTPGEARSRRAAERSARIKLPAAKDRAASSSLRVRAEGAVASAKSILDRVKEGKVLKVGEVSEVLEKLGASTKEIDSRQKARTPRPSIMRDWSPPTMRPPVLEGGSETTADWLGTLSWYDTELRALGPLTRRDKN